MTISEMGKQLQQLQGQFHETMREIFAKAQNAGLLREEMCEDGGVKWVPRTGYEFRPSWDEAYEFEADGTTLRGRKYCGGDEYDYLSIVIPNGWLDDIDGWIEAQKKAYDEHERQRLERKAVEEAEKERKAGEAERQRYLELKSKYEGAA
jgi:hypothetical protein